MIQDRVLVMIPSRDRPEELVAAAKSVLDTSTNATVVAYVDEDQASLYNGDVHKIVGPRLGPVASANRLVSLFPDFAAYGLITDDARMTTPGWDSFLFSTLERFPNRVGVVSPYHNQGNHVDMPFVSRKWIDATGWFAYPRCFHYCWPIITGLIGEMSAIMHSPMDQFAIHHPHKTEMVSMERLSSDHTAFFEFVSLELPATVERVRQAMTAPAPREIRATIPSEQWP